MYIGRESINIRFMCLSDIHCTVADLVRGVQMHRLVMYFCVRNCMSPSNDYATVAYSNNNQAQLHTHESVPY